MTEDIFSNGYITVSASAERNFEVLFKEWFDLFVAPNLASVTEENRRYMMKNHLFKAFGALDIQNVNLVRVQKFFNEKVKAGLAPDTIGKMKNLLNNFFMYAVKQHYIKANPMADIVIRRSVGSGNNDEKGKALRPEIRQQVFAWVAENTLLKPIIITFSFTGLHPQELIALTWENINLDAREISVKKAINRVIEFDDEGAVTARSIARGKTKTPKSVRSFALPDIVVEVLTEWLKYCRDNGINSEFVFPTLTGEMWTYWGLRSLLNRFIAKHGLEDEGITLYTFRHTFATILLEARENPKIVADLMGRAKVSTTLDLYSHVVSDAVYVQNRPDVGWGVRKAHAKEKPGKLCNSLPDSRKSSL